MRQAMDGPETRDGVWLGNSCPARFSAVPTAAGGITRLAYARARAAGVDMPSLLSRAGLTTDEVETPGRRLKVRNQIRFLELAAGALHDDFLGFHLALGFELRRIGLLYYVMASAETLDDALRRAERYSTIVNEGIAVHYRSGRDAAVSLRYVGVPRRSDRHQIEFWITAVVRVCRQLTNRHLRPSRITVMHRRARSTPELGTFFGCDVVFGADADEIVLPGPVPRVPVGNADPFLHEMLLGYCERALAQANASRSSLRIDLENAIVPLLPHGRAQAGEVACRLGMSKRTLARRLSAEGLTFARVLDALRKELATHYLQDKGLTISQIAWLLGYREVSAFTHAFRRWAGKPPSSARPQG